jgi:DNA adenine methylase
LSKRNKLAISDSVTGHEASLTKPKPFLRWAGGKRQLVKSLIVHLPSDVHERRYVEPFLGAGSLFFAVRPSSALLGDANRRLIETYRALCKDPEDVRRELDLLLEAHSPAAYYLVRDAYNRSVFSTLQAARFLYLNKTCFNGVYRVNGKGEFNVPIGKKDRIAPPSALEFAQVATALRNAEVVCLDYRQTLSRVLDNDFVYLDPPYPALNDTAFFNHYTADRFTEASQKSLADDVIKLHNRGVRFLMSNADTPAIRELYKSYTTTSVSVRRYITCKSQRLEVAELLIQNY